MQSLKILIVDDSPDDQNIFKELLSDSTAFNFELIQTDLGEQGLEFAKSDSPDCILLYHNLPDMTGIEFVEELRESGSNVPVVMITGMAEEVQEDEAIEKGIVEFLCKGGFDRERLEKAINRAMRTTK